MDEEENNEGIDLSKKIEEFDNSSRSQEFQSVPEYALGTPKFIRWTIKFSGGLIKTEKQAKYVMLAFIVFLIMFSVFLLTSSGPDIQERNIFNSDTADPDFTF
jgi:hypothetical protein